MEHRRLERQDAVTVEHIGDIDQESSGGTEVAATGQQPGARALSRRPRRCEGAFTRGIGMVERVGGGIGFTEEQ